MTQSVFMITQITSVYSNVLVVSYSCNIKHFYTRTGLEGITAISFVEHNTNSINVHEYIA